MDIPQQSSGNANSVLFESFYKEVWRKMIPAGLTEAEADFIEEVAGLKPGNRLLDVMCGYGRHSLELAKRGYHLTAVDNLPDYIQEIKGIAEAENLPVESRLADITTATFSGSYDAVICMGNSFAGFHSGHVTTILGNISACLKTGGVFIINSWMIGEIAIKHFQEKTWLYVDGYKYLLDYIYLFNPSRIETDHIIIAENGQTEVLKGIDYIFTFSELESLLQNAGFELREVYATPRKRKYQFGDSRAYLVIVKK
jgi:cyclopropane fatty-acyl-phospholipid synthase-like methyltransferase